MAITNYRSLMKVVATAWLQGIEQADLYLFAIDLASLAKACGIGLIAEPGPFSEFACTAAFLAILKQEIEINSINFIATLVKNDPPDPNYTEMVELRQVQAIQPYDNSAVAGAWAAYLTALDEQSAIMEALLTSFERLQGAEIDGNFQYSLLQAEAVDLYLEMLIVNQQGLVDILNNYATEFESFIAVNYDNVFPIMTEIVQSGFNQSWLDVMADLGLTPEEIDTLNETFIGLPLSSDFNTQGVEGLREWAASIEDTALPMLSVAAAEMSTLVETLQNSLQPPVLTVNEPSITVGEGDTANNQGMLSDPDNDAVALNASVGLVTNNGGTWSWSFLTSDGPAQSTAVTISGDDGNGGVGQTTFGLVVNNIAPTATFANTTGPILAGEAATLAFSGQFDPSSSDTVSGFLYSYDCTNNGSFELTDSTSPTFNCPYNTAGTFTARGRIQDKDGGFNEYTAQVVVNPPTPVNQPPVAVNDAYSTFQGGTLMVSVPGVLVNDSDPDGDPLTAALASGASNGLLTLNPNGSFAYMPNPAFSGVDSFTYTISDGRGGVATATVLVMVNPLLPSECERHPEVCITHTPHPTEDPHPQDDPHDEETPTPQPHDEGEAGH